MIDVFYLTYYGDYSQKNYDRIKYLCDDSQSIYNVADIEGIYNAHKTCAEISATENFFVVDGDAWVLEDFDFSYIPSKDIDVYPNVPQTQCTHVWRAKNPATGELAGYGGIKLFNKNAFFVETKQKIVDVTTGVAKLGFPYYRIDIASNETHFANTPFNAWKGAFRECTKLASGVATDDVQKRLDLWKNPLYIEYHKLIALGAAMGEEYGRVYQGNKDKLEKINDFSWLKRQFNNLNNV